MKQTRAVIFMLLACMFFMLAASPPAVRAATNVYTATLSSSTATTAAEFKPLPGVFAVSIIFSGDAVGTVYLERKNPSLGQTVFMPVKPYSGSKEDFYVAAGDTNFIYRCRASLSAGTATVMLAQCPGDTNKTSTF